ncbi:MAPEG family protein [Sphingobium estronivorans]|uniref:MAPEG family protein n=1 Tax=Sphingobium estronivorans TaxID=1577690 RepID=UPI00123C268B|nr:MAPEG family protein [Sphingobium estronivorans]
MLLPITLTLAAACALLNMWLGIRCARIRLSASTLHGDGGHALLARRMRAHANFTEYVPMTLILFGLVELATGASMGLWGAALVLVVARIGHGFGMDADEPTIGRAGGALMTWAVMIGLAVTALYVAYGATREVPAPPAMAMIR